MEQVPRLVVFWAVQRVLSATPSKLFTACMKTATTVLLIRRKSNCLAGKKETNYLNGPPGFTWLMKILKTVCRLFMCLLCVKERCLPYVPHPEWYTYCRSTTTLLTMQINGIQSLTLYYKTSISNYQVCSLFWLWLFCDVIKKRFVDIKMKNVTSMFCEEMAILLVLNGKLQLL